MKDFAESWCVEKTGTVSRGTFQSHAACSNIQVFDLFIFYF